MEREKKLERAYSIKMENTSTKDSSAREREMGLEF